MRTRTALTTALLAGMLAAPAAFAGDMEWSQLDTDSDGMLSREEAMGHTALSSNFAQADTDRDGMLSSAEYKAWQGRNGNKGDRMDHSEMRDGMNDSSTDDGRMGDTRQRGDDSGDDDML
ncbi:hypothetical protein [Coralloluteibacterium stylophorae]|uniref:EF-hand domain-containing protein n=1 Tax=Coralloluteibacterium stylophorae TaxID=1776034 RepID=A0A8J7VQR8_9GAMM|nr:hypothetical protein [Coralloluteibacterium stylophorae]MBS7458221.1 hypothetical protein [Coralloluteibacterium stylophorae]